MTESEVRQKVVSTAIKYLGCNEADGSHRKIIDIYNKHYPLARNYKMTYSNAWCAAFVSVVAIICGYTDIMFTECGCAAMIQRYKNAGRWQESDTYCPSSGDIIMYDWQDSGVGDCHGVPDHVGIVVNVSNHQIKVIEGNKGHAVAYRTISVNGKYVRGFCLPDYASKADSVTNGKADNKKDTSQSATVSANIEYAKARTDALAGTYRTTDDLNLRTGAGINKKVQCVIPAGDTVQCYGYYTEIRNVLWYLVAYKTMTGFVSSQYLKRIKEN